MNTLATTIPLMLSVAGANALFAQAPPASRTPPTPLDQSVADTGPLSTSLRKLDPGLQQPAGFDDVYVVPGRDDLLMRIDGGVVAVFPRSTYMRTRQGTLPLIPPGTTFYIGIPAHLALGPPLPDEAKPGALFRVRSRVLTHVEHANRPPLDSQDHDVPLTPDATVRHRAEAQARAPDQDSPSELLAQSRAFAGPTIANDSTYRARRLGVLIQQAANAERYSHQSEPLSPPSAQESSALSAE